MLEGEHSRRSQDGTVSVNGASLHYRLVGPDLAAGAARGLPAVVFAHAGICDGRMWEPQIGPFVDAGFRVLVPDLRGFGRSPMVAGPYRHRDDLAALLDALGIAGAVLVGCSRGARHVLDLTLLSPARAAALVLVSPSVGGFRFEGEEPAQVAAIQAAEARGDLEEVNRLEVEMWVAGPRRPPTAVDARILALARDMNRLALASEASCLGEELTVEPEAFGRLGTLALPVLVVTGSHDVPRTLAAARATAAAIPGAEAAAVADAAHLPSLERPEEWNSIVLSFLARHGFSAPA